MAWDTPPDDAPPALAAKLTRHSQGFMGTLFDLAQRGVLEVREDKGWWGSKKYTLELKNAAVALSAHEQGLLSAIFKPGETTVDMSAISTRLASKHKAFDEPLEQELVDRGWLDPDRKRQRRNLGVTGFLLLLATMSSLPARPVRRGRGVGSGCQSNVGVGRHSWCGGGRFRHRARIADLLRGLLAADAGR